MSIEETSFYEIVELSSGEIGLRRQGDEPLVMIKFSKEAETYLHDEKIAVAKAMIEAGLQVAFGLDEENDIQAEAAELLH